MNTSTYESWKSRKVLIFQRFSFFSEQLKFLAELSFNNIWA